MELRKSMVWAAMAALAASLLIGKMLAAQENDAPPAPATEPDLFQFIKPMEHIRGDIGAHIDSGEAAPKIPSGQAAVEAVPHAALQATLPPALREVPDATMKVTSVQDAVQKMRAQGASEDDVYRMRAAELSTQAAAQLAEMDQGEAAWKSRIGAYLAEKDRLQNEAALAGMELHDALQQLRNARFNMEEQQQLSAYEASPAPQLTF